jgi:aminoglycoside phosphotransferase (APT) family kinase protein
VSVTDEDVLTYVREQCPAFEPTGPPERLPGGNLNVVWRVPGEERSLIAKYAPPYIAAEPDIPLDPSRLRIEARCLKALSSGGCLAGVTEPTVRAPRLVGVNEEGPLLLMEDLGTRPSLDQWLRTATPQALELRAAAHGRRLGRFLGRLHATTNGPEYADAFDNSPMQETRFAVQYKSVADMLRTGGVDDAAALGSRAESLGEELLDPGCCLTMGDLWPSSVLVMEHVGRPDRGEKEVSGRHPDRGASVDAGIRLIDWELAHYGRPLQDVAHWWAHLWMQAHCASSDVMREAVGAHRTAFLTAYSDALGDTEPKLWDDTERRAAAVHVAAEILVRAVGPFQNGYAYAGLDPSHPAVQEAVTVAAEHLRAPGAVNGGFARLG